MQCTSTQTPVIRDPTVAPTAASPRIWPALVLVALYWGVTLVVRSLELLYFVGFLTGMATAAVLTLGFFVWWWTNRRIRLSDRALGFCLVLGAGALVEPLCDKSIGWFGILTGALPMVLTALTLWLLVAGKAPVPWKRLGSAATILLIYGCFTLIRIDGLTAELRANVRPRWSLTAEEQFLAERAQEAANHAQAASTSLVDWSPVLGPTDWPEFRGPNRDGVIRGVTIRTDWNRAPPQQVWRHRVGPAWSSVIVIGDRLFTQEQRGDEETMVCYNALTGKELWVHEDSARFWETVSEAGPRATPTFANGRIYALGGTGVFNCLDAATGKRYWSKDIAADAGAKIPLWGFSGSPLVVDGKAVVFAGGSDGKSLLAYDAESGDLRWTAPGGGTSYSSPQIATIAATPQVLMLDDHGLSAFNPADGTVLWHHGLTWSGAPRALQAHLLSDTRLLVGGLEGAGVALVDVAQDSDGWHAVSVWNTGSVKPEHSDFVVHQGYAYGFDVSMLSCVDLETGERRWRGGRYGRGQAVLLPDQSVILVLSDRGQAALVAANPERYEELGRFQAIKGKTWNHPVIARGRLYVRNAEEMACYDLDAE
jgi:outer membrane protein assembly factor BamB